MASIRDLLSPVVDRSSDEPETNSGDDSPELDNVPETTHFVVEFILDLVCPYCYIGFKNLTAAIETYTTKHPEATFEVVCSPYMLDPLATRSGRDSVQARPTPSHPTPKVTPFDKPLLTGSQTDRKSPPAYDKSRYLNIPKRSLEYWNELGSQAGIAFVWEGRTGSTRDAHKLLRFALEASPTTARSTAFTSRPRDRQQTTRPSPDPLPAPDGVHPAPPPRGPSLQMRWLATLLRAYHETEADISSRAFLASLFTSSSSSSSHPNLDHPPDVSRTSIPTLLTDPTWDRFLDIHFADSCSRPGLTVRAVPTFIINDRYVVGGAQSAAFWVEELERVRVGKGGRRIGEEIDGMGMGEDGMSARFYGEGEGASPPP
ncbi:hypothetical protein F5B19DRAFT_503746 [Rostrohypoxylon terebratum]|nr:hypothetical protein F5B19DRAFT_503746 [Rostrohypoxylon terebratum]